MHQIKTLGHADAQRAIAAIQAELDTMGKVAAIAVADATGELVALLRLDGTPLACIQNATHKAFTSAREGKLTIDIGKANRDPVKGFDIAYYGDKRYIGWGGGVPVRIDGQVVGAVGVSGLPQEVDQALAQIGVDAIVGKVS